jgi:hypothetical protein
MIAEPERVDEFSIGVRAALDRFIADDPDRSEANGVPAATEILLAATADRLLRRGTLTRQQVAEMIAAIGQSPQG